MEIKDRLDQLVKHKGLTPRAFALKIGTSSQVFGNYLAGRDPSFEVIGKIIETFDDVSPDWLITGRGPMLRDERPAPVVSPPDLERENMALKEVIAEKNTEIRQLNREIGSLEEKLGTRGQGASPRFYSTRKSDEPNVPDVSGTHDNPHVAPAIPPKRDGRQTARK